jgi:hypothetical protein
MSILLKRRRDDDCRGEPRRTGRRWRRSWGRALGLLVAAYLLAVTFGAGCAADRLVLFPPPGAIDAGGADRIVLARSKANSPGELEIWRSHTPGVEDGEAEAFVLEFCGNATRAEQIAQFVPQRWRRHAVETWVVNYPGYGGSAGRPRLADIPPAALDAYDALARRAAGRPIFVEANSLGTTAALYVAAHRPTAGLVLQNPPALRPVILGHAWWNLGLLAVPIAIQIPAELDSPRNAAAVRVPAVFLMADHDEVVRPKYQKMVVDAYAGPKRIVPLVGLSHGSSITGENEARVEAAVDWLWAQHAAAASAAAQEVATTRAVAHPKP